VSDHVTVTERTTRPSLAAALVVAAAVVIALEGSVAPGVAAEVAGLVLLTVGVGVARGNHRVAGVAVAVVGAGVLAAGIGAAVSSTTGFAAATEVIPGAVGVAVLGLGLVPLRGAGSRFLLKAGTGLLLVSVVASGLFRRALPRSLLLASVGVVLAWDAGETAIDVGEQVGREPATAVVEATHLGASALVGLVAVAAGFVVMNLGTPGLPLESLAFLLVALVLLTLALHD
jgi:hypothetical protein